MWTGFVSTWLPYVAFAPDGRRSLCGGDDVARIATDIVESAVPIVAIEVRSDATLDAVAISTPIHRRSSAPATSASNASNRASYLPKI